MLGITFIFDQEETELATERAPDKPDDEQPVYKEGDVVIITNSKFKNYNGFKATILKVFSKKAEVCMEEGPAYKEKRKFELEKFRRDEPRSSVENVVPPAGTKVEQEPTGTNVEKEPTAAKVEKAPSTKFNDKKMLLNFFGKSDSSASMFSDDE